MNKYDEQFFREMVVGVQSRHTTHCDVEYNEDLDIYLLFKDKLLVGGAKILANGRIVITNL